MEWGEGHGGGGWGYWPQVLHCLHKDLFCVLILILVAKIYHFDIVGLSERGKEKLEGKVNSINPTQRCNNPMQIEPHF